MDIETLVYIVFFIIFIVTRIYQGMKKAKENAPTINPPEPSRDYEYSAPKKETSEKPKDTFDDVFGDLLKEIQKQQTQREPEPIPAPVYNPKPQPKKAIVKKTASVISETEGRQLIEAEGVSAFKHTANDEPVYSWETEGGSISAGYKKMMEDSLSSAEDNRFEFNPRYAFMMKTLLEKKHF